MDWETRLPPSYHSLLWALSNKCNPSEGGPPYQSYYRNKYCEEDAPWDRFMIWWPWWYLYRYLTTPYKNINRRALGVTNLVEDIFNKRPTVVGWGYTSGFDPYSQELQGDLAEYGVAARTLQKLDVSLNWLNCSFDYVSFQIPALDNETCTTKFGGLTPRSTQLCAGHLRDNIEFLVMWHFLDPLASFDFKLSVSQSVNQSVSNWYFSDFR